MSLRLRLVASVVLVLAVSFSLGACLVAWRAERSVRTELQAALEVGEQTVRNGIEDLAGAANAREELERLALTFDGDRHVRAMLLDRAGASVTVSHPLQPGIRVPAWFLWLVAPKLDTAAVAVPVSAGGGRLVLEPDPTNEASEVWASFGDSSLVLAVFCLLASGAILLVLHWGLAPLAQISAAFGRIGDGDYSVRVPVCAPRELARLANGLNRMAERLAAMETQNRRLREQLLTLQDEERADIARDLHDEIGPFLFAVNVSAAGIGRLAGEGRLEGIPEHVGAIREAVSHMQKHVKEILARLRPLRAAEFGLGPALASLAAFWRRGHPGIAFEVELDPRLDTCGEAVEEVVYRIVQEGISNAVRHGRPLNVEVRISREHDDVLVRVTDDGSGGGAPGKASFGLVGMRERVASVRGTLLAGPRPGTPGWEVLARLPYARAETRLEAGAP